MIKHKTPLDFIGKKLFVGDIVLIKTIPNELLRDLLDEDQKAINNCLGQFLPICGFDLYGNAEIDFIDQDGNQHTMWICTNCLIKHDKMR